MDRLGELSPAFRDASFELALELKVDLDRDAGRTTRWFRSGIADCYRSGIMERLKRHGAADLTELALRLKVDKSVRSRWERGEVLPDWDSLFLGATSYRVTWDGALPNSSAALTGGICRAVAEIRRELLGKDGGEPDLSILALMRYMNSNSTWARAELSHDPKIMRKALDDANAYVSQRIGAPYRKTRADIIQLIDEWSMAYGMFQLLIPYDWPF